MLENELEEINQSDYESKIENFDDGIYEGIYDSQVKELIDTINNLESAQDGSVEYTHHEKSPIIEITFKGQADKEIHEGLKNFDSETIETLHTIARIRSEEFSRIAKGFQVNLRSESKRLPILLTYTNGEELISNIPLFQEQIIEADNE